MKQLLSLCAAGMLVACGQRNEPPKDEQPPAPATAPSTPSAPTPPPSSGASVTLAPTQGNTAAGTLTAATMGEGVHLSGTLRGLPPNREFGFHIHEKGDCSAPDASSAGEHFNPANAQHGNPQADPHHAGDMLNVKSDAQGNAQVEAHVSGVSLDSGAANGVLDKAVVVHEKADDYSTQPSGNSGARIACGVISNAAATTPASP
jgi:Cu-Zn family superoxide dismutase